MFQAQEDLLSVIIPAYNAENYIRTAIDCLLHQTYASLEIILVDNGSTDGTFDICDEYSGLSSSIRVIHLQKNQGVYGARNTGLEAAHGRYIAFMDADDGIDEYAYELLINAIVATGSDVAACGYKVEYSDGFTIRKSKPAEVYPYEYNGKDNVLSGVGNPSHDLTGFVWNKVFTRASIGNTRFSSEAPICDDMIFVYDVLANVNRATHIDLPMYHYRYVSSSLSKGEKDISKFLGCLRAMDRLYQSCTDTAPQCLDSIAKTYLFWNTKTCEQMLESPDKQAFQEVKANIKAYRNYISKCSARVRILCYAILISWYLYRPLGLMIWHMKQIYITMHRKP